MPRDSGTSSIVRCRGSVSVNSRSSGDFSVISFTGYPMNCVMPLSRP